MTHICAMCSDYIVYTIRHGNVYPDCITICQIPSHPEPCPNYTATMVPWSVHSVYVEYFLFLKSSQITRFIHFHCCINNNPLSLLKFKANVLVEGTNISSKLINRVESVLMSIEHTILCYKSSIVPRNGCYRMFHLDYNLIPLLQTDIYLNSDFILNSMKNKFSHCMLFYYSADSGETHPFLARYGHHITTPSDNNIATMQMQQEEIENRTRTKWTDMQQWQKYNYFSTHMLYTITTYSTI